MRTVVTIALLLLLAPATASATPQQDLDAAEARWAALGADDYRFTLQLSCFCPSSGPWDVVVRDGEPRGAGQIGRSYDTVPELFATVQRHIDEGDDHTVAYDPRTGVVARLSADPIKEAADDQYSVAVSDFAIGRAPDPDAPDPSIADGSAAEALAAARRRWAARGLRSYDFRLRLSCFCPVSFTRPRTMEVRRGRPRSPGRLREYATVPRLFGVIADAIDGEVSTLEVRYARSGLPRRIFIDADRRAADEERTISASRLRQP